MLKSYNQTHMFIIVFYNLLILHYLNLSIHFKENIFTQEKQSMN